MFSAHIYSSDEIRRYFSAVDTYDSGMNLYHKVQFPILFRLLYCCGTRITETLMIRKKDVDLEEGMTGLWTCIDSNRAAAQRPRLAEPSGCQVNRVKLPRPGIFSLRIPRR